MTEEKIKERLSESFITTIGHRAGLLCTRPAEDYGVDLTIARVEQIQRNGATRYLQTNESIDFRLKCTTEAGVELANGLIRYDLAVKTYNDLIHRRDELPPLVLLLYIIPNDPGAWLGHDDEIASLILRGRGYWYVPDAADQASGNVATKRIEIPVVQQVRINTLTDLFGQIYA